MITPMERWYRLGFMLFGVGALAACQAEDEVISDGAREELALLGPLGAMPASPSNAVADNPQAAELGTLLFSDPKFSGSGQMACSECHLPREGWSDDGERSTTDTGGDTPRHSQTLTNVAFQRYFFWNGKSDSLWAQAFKAWSAVHNISGSEDVVVAYLASQPDYVEAYTALFPDDPLPDPDDIDPPSEAQLTQILVNCSKAVEAFERLLVSRDSDLDRWIGGDEGALTEAQKRGAALFVGEGGCDSCHSGPNLSDNWFHNIGLVPGLDEVSADGGLALTLNDETFNSASALYSDDPAWGAQQLQTLMTRVSDAGDSLVGAHKTPTLRDVTLRRRFGHNGDITDLRVWIGRYRDAAMDEGSVGEADPEYFPRDLSDQDIDDLVEFMGALTGDPSSADLEL